MSDAVSSKAKTGCVYFVRRVNSMKWVKIGWTSDAPEWRLKKLQTGSPETLVLAGIQEDKTQKDELALHHRFKAFRQSGEWFYVKGELFEYLRAFCGWSLGPWTRPVAPGTIERRRKRQADQPPMYAGPIPDVAYLSVIMNIYDPVDVPAYAARCE